MPIARGYSDQERPHNRARDGRAFGNPNACAHRAAHADVHPTAGADAQALYACSGNSRWAAASFGTGAFGDATRSADDRNADGEPNADRDGSVADSSWRRLSHALAARTTADSG